MAESVTQTGGTGTKSTGAVGSLGTKKVDNTRIVVLAHIAFALILAYMFKEGLDLLFAQAWARPFVASWPGPSTGWLRPGMVLGAVVGVVGMAIVAMNARVQKFANEVINELRKVTWPEWKETRQTTIVVLIATGIIALILGGWDLMFSKLIKALLAFKVSGS